MNIVFLGSSQFGVPSLKALLDNGYNISCVITQPDRKKGRGLLLERTPVKSAALDYGLKIYQPDQINTTDQVKLIKSLNADLFVVIAYGQILSQQILDIPKIFSVNAHASFLPKYRGAAPINWAIIKGEKTTGVTIIKINEEMDAGPIILQEHVGIGDNDTAITLEDKLSQAASQLLIMSLKLIEKKKYILTEQDESKITFAPKLKKDDGLVDWKMSADDIYNFIRGCAGWPGALTFYKEKLLKIHKAFPETSQAGNASGKPGEIVDVSKNGIVVACAKGYLSIKELQIEGKKIMKTQEFISGHKITPGEMLGK